MPSRPDILAQTAIQRGAYHVDVESGAIYKRTGERAEILDKRMGYGRIMVYTKPLTWAMAHRMIWIAAYEMMIPPGLQINHRNRRRWDNRISNLELVSAEGNNRHWRGMTYDHVGVDAEAVQIDWLGRLDVGDKVTLPLDPYGKTNPTPMRNGRGKVIRFF